MDMMEILELFNQAQVQHYKVPVRTYPDIFESARIRIFLNPHVSGYFWIRNIPSSSQNSFSTHAMSIVGSCG